MSSKIVKRYFLTIKIVSQKGGKHMPDIIRKISDLLSDKAPGFKVVHKLKVTGEAKVVAFLEVSDSAELERTVTKLWELGGVELDCQPIICYEDFAETMKVADELCSKSSSCLQKDDLYLLEFTVEYHGHKFEDFMKIWKKEAEAVLSQRRKGEVKLELFKTVAQRRVLLLINELDPTKLDHTAFHLPIMIDNGNNILIKSRSVQYLDDYSARLAALKL